jgi:hypothetical protein
VRIANGSIANAIGYGRATIGEMVLSEVWFVPTFGNTRLLSVSALDSEGYSILFSKGKATCIKDNVQYFKAPLYNDVYMVEEQARAASASASSITSDLRSASHDTSTIPSNITTNTKESLADLWHRRLAHTNHNDIQRLQHTSIGMGIFPPKQKTSGDHACEGCLAGKMKESFNKKTDSRTTQRIRRLHCDTSGIRQMSYRGYRYFMVITDDATRFSWVRLLKSKSASEAYPALMEVIKMIERDTGDKVVMVRADNAKGEFGPEFQNRCKEDGMQFEPCPAYKHSLNGVSERAVYTTDCKIRSLLFDSKLPIDLWCLAAEHAIWIKNRVPTIALPFGSGRLGTSKTPYEAYTEQVPNLEHVKAFGCAAYPILPKGKHP